MLADMKLAALRELGIADSIRKKEDINVYNSPLCNYRNQSHLDMPLTRLAYFITQKWQ